MAYGWTGTILRVHLTKKKIVKIPTAKYTEKFISPDITGSSRDYHSQGNYNNRHTGIIPGQFQI